MPESNQPDDERPLAVSVRPGDTIADKYVIGEVLGVGGMGVVMAARDTALDRAVAIKFLQSRLAGAETAVRRFIREARAATRISSEHVVRLLDIDRLPDGTPFFVMERLHGRDLDALLDELGWLPPNQAVDYSLQALEAIAEGHLKGVVHRDLKPSNLFLTLRADGTPLIKVLDFGIAKTFDDEPTQSTALTSSEDVRLGSPAYMPPEQLRDPRDVDTRADIWSLGVTLYELVSGSPPFEGHGYVELVSNILSGSPPPLRSPSGEPLPEGLEAVISKCLAKERAERFTNAAELAAALAPFGGEDARLSLSRVRGLWSSNSSIPPVSLSNLSGHPRSSTTTLPVATEPAAELAPKISAPKAQRSPRRGSWIAIAVASAAISGAIAWHQPGTARLSSALQAIPAAVPSQRRAPSAARLSPPAATPSTASSAPAAAPSARAPSLSPSAPASRTASLLRKPAGSAALPAERSSDKAAVIATSTAATVTAIEPGDSAAAAASDGVEVDSSDARLREEIAKGPRGLPGSSPMSDRVELASPDETAAH